MRLEGSSNITSISAQGVGYSVCFLQRHRSYGIRYSLVKAKHSCSYCHEIDRLNGDRNRPHGSQCTGAHRNFQILYARIKASCLQKKYKRLLHPGGISSQNLMDTYARTYHRTCTVITYFQQGGEQYHILPFSWPHNPLESGPVCVELKA